MQKVIACIDGSSISNAVCDAAAWAASLIKAPLLLLHTVEKPDLLESDLSGAIGVDARDALMAELAELDAQRNRLAVEHGKAILAAAKTRATEDGASDIELLQRHGDVLDALEEKAEDIRLIVMGRHGNKEGISNHLGSHAERAARVRSEPLLMTVGEFRAPTNFMLAYDGRDTSKKALQRVMASPLLQSLPCHLVMVGDNTQANQVRLDDAATSLKQAGFEVKASLLNGPIFSALQQYKRENNIALLVMGAYGHSAVREFFVGSNTTRMISSSETPLLIIK
jgi:nucleotide-binding universal stress UspA family protein